MLSTKLKEYDFRKCIEELAELVTILMQQMNKTDRDFTEDVIEEIGDVYYRLENLCEYFDEEKISDRINFKRNKNADKREELKNVN